MNKREFLKVLQVFANNTHKTYSIKSISLLKNTY